MDGAPSRGLKAVGRVTWWAVRMAVPVTRWAVRVAVLVRAVPAVLCLCDAFALVARFTAGAEEGVAAVAR